MNAVLGVTGRHGFDITIDSPPGDQSIQVFAINVGGGTGNPLLGRGQVRVGIPMGSLDVVTAAGQIAERAGLGLRPGPTGCRDPGRRLPERGRGRLVPDRWSPRPDVNSVFGIGGRHGFNIQIDAPPGNNSVQVYAINVGPAAGNPLIGTRSARVV